MKILKFYKPFEVLSKFTDHQGRQTLRDFIPIKSVYPAGRLDYRSEGLLILTDSGKINQRITSPTFKFSKVYLVQVEGIISDEAVYRLENLIVIPQAQSQVAEYVEIVQTPNVPPRTKPVRDYHPTSWIQLSLKEGKKHQIRRMTAAVGYPTLRLIRIKIGPVELGELAPGEWSYLSPFEMDLIHPNH